MKKHIETWWKSCFHQRDQLSPVPPDEYAARFVKFIRTNIKTREVIQEKTEEQTPTSPLTTIEEREDQRLLERTAGQIRKESLSNVNEEMDVGRTTTLSPTCEKSEHVLPTVTMQENKDSMNDADTALTENENEKALTNKEIATSHGGKEPRESEDDNADVV